MNKLFYSIGEVEKMLGESQATIKFWEQQFPHLNPRRTAGLTRRYSSKDIDALKVVKSLLRDKGMTIAGAKEMLKRRRGPLELRQDTITRLRGVLKKLEHLKSQI